MLANESRLVAQKESNRQTRKLTQEIDAHQETDKALQSAKELAERSNAAKSRYLTGISHELRTPLQSIIGYAQLLSDKNEMPPQHQHGLEIIQRSGEYLADLIEGLLDISKIEAGRLDLYRNTVDLPALIEQLCNMFSIQATSKGIQFQNHTLDPLPQSVITDEKRLRQILINLLSNAIKYTKAGNVDFSIRYRNQVAEFVIKDSGPGIPENQMARIFDPFERVRNTETANFPGTGLGLTIVKLLTEIMGGDLQAHSVVGEGSEFKVSLMLPWVTKENTIESTLQRVIGYHGSQKKIFVVDDDPVVRGLLADILVPLNFITYEAYNGEHCLSQLPDAMPDLFILDVSMPGMSGLELAKALRQQGIKIPIIMLSADAQEQHRKPDETATFNDYLVKPVNNQTLLEIIAANIALDWIYQSQQPVAHTTPSMTSINTATMATESSYIPDHELLRELMAFAEMGYKKGVGGTLQKIATLELLPHKHQQKLEQFYSVFQFDLLAEYLDKHSHNATIEGANILLEDNAHDASQK